MAVLESLYTPQKVYRPLADALDVARDAEVAHYDRFSIQDGSGIESQVARHCALYPSDPDVAAYRALLSSAFDNPAAGVAHGIRWLSLADIHHSMTDPRPVVALVVIGRTVFFRVELSAVERQIQRADGDSENAFTTLVLAVTNHLRRLQVSRWADDVTRAARENVNWGLIMRRHHERGICMRLGGVVYNLAKKGDRTSLKLLGAVGSEDDPERRKKLLGARLTGVRRLTTSQVPVNLSTGTSNDTSDVFTGDFSQLYVGVRTALTITVLRERYMVEEGSFGLVGWYRGDVAVARPKAFDIVRSLRS
jgi:hypothetical protein